MPVDMLFLVLFCCVCSQAYILPWGWDRDHGPNEPIPVYSLPSQYLRYILQPRNLIDLMTILPFYILEYGSFNGKKVTQFIRVLRLARVFKLLNTSEVVTDMSILIFATLEKSLPALSVMIIFSFFGMIFFGSLIYVFEAGRFSVTSGYPQGVYLRRTVNHASLEPSPFNSIPSSIYWAITTGITGKN